MSNDTFRKLILSEIGLRQSLGGPILMKPIIPDQSSLAKLANQNSEILQSFTQAQTIIKQFGGIASMGEIVSKSSLTLAAIPNIAQKFELPEVATLSALQKSLALPTALEALGRYNLEASTFSQVMKGMNTPWLNFQNRMASISGLMELQGIGQILATMPSYDDSVTSILRNDLGDWRGPLLMDPTKLLDQAIRTDFYLERGFDPNLTAFPEKAFSEGLEAAGLFESVPESKSDEIEAGFMRTNKAHDRLMRFEFHLRKFIEKEMTQAFGPDWIKHQVPANMRETWENKMKGDATTEDRDQALISYADFTDYVAIICRKDNWNAVFKTVFNQVTSVQESFRRLFPVRICTMHARPLTQEDALYLLVEIKRMNKAMGIET